MDQVYLCWRFQASGCCARHLSPDLCLKRLSNQGGHQGSTHYRRIALVVSETNSPIQSPGFESCLAPQHPPRSAAGRDHPPTTLDLEPSSPPSHGVGHSSRVRQSSHLRHRCHLWLELLPLPSSPSACLPQIPPCIANPGSGAKTQMNANAGTSLLTGQNKLGFPSSAAPPRPISNWHFSIRPPLQSPITNHPSRL